MVSGGGRRQLRGHRFHGGCLGGHGVGGGLHGGVCVAGIGQGAVVAVARAWVAVARAVMLALRLSRPDKILSDSSWVRWSKSIAALLRRFGLVRNPSLPEPLAVRRWRDSPRSCWR